MDPPGAGHDARVPRLAVAQRHAARFVQCLGRDRFARRVLQHDARRTVQVGVDVKVAWGKSDGNDECARFLD